MFNPNPEIAVFNVKPAAILLNPDSDVKNGVEDIIAITVPDTNICTTDLLAPFTSVIVVGVAPVKLLGILCVTDGGPMVTHVPVPFHTFNC